MEKRACYSRGDRRAVEFLIDQHIEPDLDNEQLANANAVIKEIVHTILGGGKALQSEGGLERLLAQGITAGLSDFDPSLSIDSASIVEGVVKYTRRASGHQADRCSSLRVGPSLYTRSRENVELRLSGSSGGTAQFLQARTQQSIVQLQNLCKRHMQVFVSGNHTVQNQDMELLNEVFGDELPKVMTEEDTHIKVVAAYLQQICKFASQNPNRGVTIISRFLTNYATVPCHGEGSQERRLALQKELIETLREEFQQRGAAIILPFYILQTELGDRTVDIVHDLLNALEPQNLFFRPFMESASPDSLELFKERIDELGELLSDAPKYAPDIFLRFLATMNQVYLEVSAEVIGEVDNAMVEGWSAVLANPESAQFRDDLRLLFLLGEGVIDVEVDEGRFEECPIINDLEPYNNIDTIIEGVKEDLELEYVDEVANTTDDPSKAAFMFHARPHASSQRTKFDAVGEVKVSLNIGLRKLREMHGDDEVFPVFVGTEWHFIATSSSELQQCLDRLADLSRQFPRVLLIPGSIGWSDWGDETKLWRVAFNSMPTFLNGRLVNLYHKTREKQDIETISKCSHVGTPYAWGPEKMKKLMAQYNSNHSQVQGITVGVEICNDHIHSMAQEAYKTRHPTGIGANLQILMAHGSQPSAQRTAVVDGGTFAYMDHSKDARSQIGTISHSYGMTRWRRLNNKRGMPRQTINRNTGKLGAFKTHIPEHTVSLAPSYLEIPDSWKLCGEGANGFFQAFAEAMGVPAMNVRTVLAQHLETNKQEYYYLDSPPPNSSIRDASFHSDLYRRYTFPDYDTIVAVIDALSAGEEPPIPPEHIPQLVSDALSLNIKIHQDLASAPYRHVTHDRSQPTEGIETPWNVGYSYQNSSFYLIPDEATAVDVGSGSGSSVDVPYSPISEE